MPVRGNSDRQGPLSKTYFFSSSGLLHGYALCQVARFVHIASADGVPYCEIPKFGMYAP